MMKNKLLYGLIAVMLLFMSHVAFSQTPNLRSTSTFGLFTGSGAIFNNALSVTSVNGNIGTDAGDFNTAGGPIIVTGSTHVMNAVSAQAKIDVDLAFGELSTFTCGVPALVGDLGNRTLTPGVYCKGDASTLTGTLTLDGLNNPNATFIIKINGALMINSNARVELINGASLCNVFFQVNGAVEFGINSIFRGTVISSGALNLLHGDANDVLIEIDCARRC